MPFAASGGSNKPGHSEYVSRVTLEREYVLSTNDEEVARLALQHRVWRDQVLDVWRRADFSQGHTIVDVGCGSGNATLDLADIVGAEGRVHALDQSRRFLDVLEARAHDGLSNINTHCIDLDRDPLPDVMADGAWDRWVLSFMTHPREFIGRLSERLKPGARLVIHEYFDYGTWRTAPPSREIDEFVAAVMRTWRDSGGEPNLGLHLPAWLESAGFELREIRPIVELTRTGEPKWSWLAAFIESGRRRLEALGALTADQSAAIGEALISRASDPHSLMVTPALLEILAIRGKSCPGLGSALR
jgi:SAM-dependent methyltransferase